MWNFIVKILLFVSATRRVCEGVCTPVYGGEPCTYLPAPPGRIPPCARPGETFCEHIEQYPMQHIHYLIEKWSYDYSTLLTDETTEKFNSYFSQPDYGYGANGPNSIPPSSYYPEPIYIPKPSNPPYSLPGNMYIPPPVNSRLNYTSNFAGYPDRRAPVRYPNYNQPSNFLGNYNGFQASHAHGPHNYFAPSQTPAFFGHHPHGVGRGAGQQPVSHYDPNSWWRYTRDNKNVVTTPNGRTKRSPISKKFKKLMKKFESAKNGTNREHSRSKRQAAGGAQTLCQARTQLIMPEAAMNTRGNWMYVVNLQQMENQYTQLVNTEVCSPASQTCSNLCSLPTGYTSRCEQKYVQKRLVALESTGQNLYTDMFWIPSCCVCMISAG